MKFEHPKKQFLNSIAKKYAFDQQNMKSQRSLSNLKNHTNLKSNLEAIYFNEEQSGSINIFGYPNRQSLLSKEIPFLKSTIERKNKLL